VCQVAVLARVVVLVAVLVSACTVPVSGTPEAGETLPAVPAELTAEAVFDDLTTVDPCSLTDLSVFETFGSATFGTPDWLDYCVVNVELTGGGAVTMNIGLFGELAATPELEGRRVKDVERGVWVGAYSDDPEYCTQLLVFPDEVTMEVHGYAAEGDVDGCPMVEAGMDHAIEVVLAEGVEHRTPEQNSFVLVDPCSLVSDADVTTATGLAGLRKPADHPGKHRCYWEAGETAGLAINFGAGPRLSGTQDLAGRPSVVDSQDVGERSYCTVETAHIPFTEVEGVDDAFELASVYVRLPSGQSDAACAAARAIAELVWPKLPAA
jgi:hypothetical protein